MQNLLLPTELDRRAVAANFDFISPAGWEGLFDREKHNGLFALRVPGPDYDQRTYYSTAGLIDWLIRNGRYSLAEIRHRFYDPPVGPTVKVHLIAG